MDPTERLLRACRRQPVDRPPVWLMRQAGRYQASYQAVRRKVSFMELCRTPKLACDVTLMPIEQIGADAAILFCDILVPLERMGLEVSFDSKGPHVGPPVRTDADVDRLRVDGVADELTYVYEAIERIVEALDGSVPLLGFAGAPLTLAAYMIEGGTTKTHHELKSMMYNAPERLERMLDKVTRVLISYLRQQIKAGAVAVQLFDTWGGVLTLPQWRQFSQKYTTRVMEGIADLGAPIMHYVKTGAHLMPGLAELPCDVLSVDWRQPLSEVRALTGGRFALQGNIDPGVLRAPHSVIDAAVRENFESYGPGPGLIVNLGHGITPDVTVEAAKALIDSVKRQGPAWGGDPNA